MSQADDILHHCHEVEQLLGAATEKLASQLRILMVLINARDTLDMRARILASNLRVSDPSEQIDGLYEVVFSLRNDTSRLLENLAALPKGAARDRTIADFEHIASAAARALEGMETPEQRAAYIAERSDD